MQCDKCGCDEVELMSTVVAPHSATGKKFVIIKMVVKGTDNKAILLNLTDWEKKQFIVARNVQFHDNGTIYWFGLDAKCFMDTIEEALEIFNKED